MNSDKLVKKWLELFGNPAVFLLNKEWRDLKKSKSINIRQYFGLENAMEVNNTLPYQLAFSPNGNLWKVNVIGQEVHHEKADAEDYVASLMIDLDMDKSNYENKEDYFNYITSEIESSHIKISYIVETGRWYHAYLLIRTENRNAVGKLLSWIRLKELECKLAELFDGWDKSSHSIVKLMRLPFSKYWKWYPSNLWDFTCKLMKFTWDNRWNLVMENVTKPEQISLEWIELLSLTSVKAMLWNIEDEKKYEVKYETQNPKDNSKFNSTCEEVNKLNIIEVIEKLASYPREYEGNSYVFKVYKWTHIWFMMNWNSELITTDGYTINRNLNYVQNFSDMYHPIDERPRWQTYPFLHYYFKWDRIKLNKFLADEYWITFKNKSDWVEESYLTFDTDSWTFDFASDGVWCHSSNWTKRIMPTPICVKWKYETQYTLQWETEEMNTYFLINIANKKGDYNIKPQFDRKKFNAMYGWMWLATKATENELIDLWHWLSSLADNWTISTYKYIYLNWYYPDLYIIWDTAYNHNAEEVDTEPINIILDAPRVDTYHTSEDVTINEFWEKFRQLYSDRESMIMFTSFITLLTWHNFWVPVLKKHITQVLIPGLFLSGKSQSWKTTAITICKHWFGLSTESKKFSVKWATAQPINQASTDCWLLHLEEWTGKIGEDKETIVRNILNKSTIARWLVSWDNVSYNYKASVIIDWETSPSSESVVNRCIYIPFYKDDRIGNVAVINSFSELSYFKDFIIKLYQIDKDKIWETYQVKQRLLMDNGLTDRVASNYAYILCVNEWFNIYDEEELLKAIRQNMELDKTVAETRLDLSSLFSELFTEKKTRATKTYTDENITQFFIPISDETLQQHKVDIMGIIRRYWNEKVRAMWNNLVITYDSRDKSERNIELWQILNLFDSHLHENRTPDLILV